MYRHRNPWRLFVSILKEALPFIALSFLILTSLVFLQQVGKYSNYLLSLQSSNQTTIRFMLCLIPSIVIITLPVALLLGTVIACSRLSSDGELTAAQALGVSKINLALPFLTYGLLGTLLIFYLSGYVAPRAVKQLKDLRDKILLDEANTQIRPHDFVTAFPNVLLYVQDVDTRTGEWLGVFILQQDQSRPDGLLLTSERGRLRITSGPSLALEAELYRGLSLENRMDGTPTPQATPGKAADSQAASDFDKLSIKLTKKDPTPEDDPNDFNTAIVERTLTEVAAIARSAPQEKDRLRATVEWHKRLAFSFACLTLTGLTFIIALSGKRFSTRPRTVIMILFIAMAFYLLLIAGQNIALSGAVPPWLGAWLSNMALALYVIKSFITSKRLFVIADLPAYLAGLWPSRAAAAGADQPARKANGKEGRRSLVSNFGLINLINYLIVTEVVKYYLLAVTALVVTSIVFTLFDLIPSLSKSDSSLGYAMTYLGYLAPQLAYHVSPFAMLVAILTGCSVLARSNQLVILSSAGQSKARIITAILIASSSLSVVLWTCSDYVLPKTNTEQDIRYHKIKNKQLERTTIAFGKKWVFGKNNTIYSYQRIEPDNSLVNTSMYHLSPIKGLIEKATHFGTATQLAPALWQAADGWMDTIQPDLTIFRRPLQAGTQQIRIDDGPSLFKRTVNESSKMSSHDLHEYINQLKGIGVATTELQLDLKKRVAFPFSCLTLALLAMPFATTRYSRRATPVMSVALGVGISLIFWLLMILFEAAGKQSNLPITMSVWAPQILLIAVAMYLNFRYRSN